MPCSSVATARRMSEQTGCLFFVPTYSLLLAMTADVRASRAKMMPNPTHANTPSGLSVNIAKKGAGKVTPKKNDLKILYIAVSFRMGSF